MERLADTVTIDALPFPYERDKDYDKWVEARWDYVSSSQIPSLLGLNPYSSLLKYWKEYTDRKSSFTSNDYTDAGTTMEVPIQKLAEKQNKGYIIEPLNKTYISKEYPFITATPDGLVKVPHRTTIGLNETKFTQRDMDLWEKGTVPGWVYAQVQLQLGVLKLDWCLVTAMVQGKPKIFCLEVEFNPTVFQSLVMAAERFLGMVKNGLRPDATGLQIDSDVVNRIVTKVPEGVMEAPSKDVVRMIEELVEVQASIDDAYNTYLAALDNRKKELENNLKLLTEGFKEVKTPSGLSLKVTRVEVEAQNRAAYSYYKLTTRKAKK